MARDALFLFLLNPTAEAGHFTTRLEAHINFINPVLVELVRAGVIESSHRGAVAICDASGRLRQSVGAVGVPVYPRSAFKALQALPMVETGAADAAGVSDEELALACASHSGEPMHTSRVHAWLSRIACREPDLACGPHLPYHEKTAHDMIRRDESPCRVHNNCSGKHAGFLTLARHLGVPNAGYEHPGHPVQQCVRKAVAEMCDVAPDAMPVGIDGCAAPNYAIPLSNLATGMARMANPTSLPAPRAAAADRLVSAWKAHPLLVSGTGRACADLIAASRGRTVVKTGAEAVFMAALPERGLGIALKIDDGGTRAAETVMAALLVQLGQADPDDPRVARHRNPPLKNWRGDIVGERRATAALGVFGSLD